MGWRVVQDGEGPRRPLVLIAHGASGSKERPEFIDERIRAAAGRRARIVNYTAAYDPVKNTTGGAYLKVGARSTVDGGVLLSWSEIEAKYGQGFDVSKRLAFGFSAGCQYVRALSESGAPLDAAGAIDGVHGDAPTPLPWQKAWWRPIVEKARLDHALAIFTVSRIDPPSNTLPDRKMVELITGLGPFEAGTFAQPNHYTEGGIHVYAYPGNDKAAHEFQLQVVLPLRLNEALVRLGELRERGPESIALASLLPPNTAGAVWPTDKVAALDSKRLGAPFAIATVLYVSHVLRQARARRRS